MKSKIFIFLLVVLGLLLSFSSCEKEEGCKAVITVKLLRDTNQVVPYANIRIWQVNSDINVNGQADAKGRFEHLFKNEAILNVTAWSSLFIPFDTLVIDTLANDTMYGETTIRLKKGETVYKSVFID
ncbi:MAG: hypothetical protein WBL11_00165 [Bacteroidales bacterium]|mgnify:CR=1 FL=1|jgi:hypothetical protein|nr:hypothetical protein [Bacteroidales bacterium]MDI9576276.1 hypothetical protein [Bacteroidota bacterium]MDD3756253.1 hypothetical protein [Bacteroidales bacterium]MDY0400607.1 hypothetical protein [Bacteroidales bacterium]HHW59534.1 hypothetical protein [Bacteroidales bacterium]